MEARNGSDVGDELEPPQPKPSWPEIKDFLPQFVAVVAGLGYLTGFVAVRRFAAVLGVAVADLGISTEDYLAMAATGTMFVIIVLGFGAVGVALVDWVVKSRKKREWGLRATAYRLVAPVIAFGAAIGVASAGGFASLIPIVDVSPNDWAVKDWHSGLKLLLASAALTGVAFLMARTASDQTTPEPRQAEGDQSDQGGDAPPGNAVPTPHSEAQRAAGRPAKASPGEWIVIGCLVLVVAGVASGWRAVNGVGEWAAQLKDPNVAADEPPVWVVLVLDANEGIITSDRGLATCVIRLSDRVYIRSDGSVRVEVEPLPFRPDDCMAGP